MWERERDEKPPKFFKHIRREIYRNEHIEKRTPFTEHLSAVNMELGERGAELHKTRNTHVHTKYSAARECDEFNSDNRILIGSQRRYLSCNWSQQAHIFIK